MLAFISVAAVAFSTLALASPAAVLGVSITATAPASASSTAAGPNPADVYINSIAYGGTGCPQGTVGSFISTDRSTSVFWRTGFLTY